MLAVNPLLALIGLLTSLTSATSLTYKLPPNEKECFYTWTEQADAKIAFYFAVQSGGDFDGRLLLLFLFEISPRWKNEIGEHLRETQD